MAVTFFFLSNDCLKSFEGQERFPNFMFYSEFIFCEDSNTQYFHSSKFFPFDFEINGLKLNLITELFTNSTLQCWWPHLLLFRYIIGSGKCALSDITCVPSQIPASLDSLRSDAIEFWISKLNYGLNRLQNATFYMFFSTSGALP